MKTRTGTKAAADRRRARRRGAAAAAARRHRPHPDWVLDERTRKVGRQGVAQAREILRRVAPPEAGPQGELTAPVRAIQSTTRLGVPRRRTSSRPGLRRLSPKLRMFRCRAARSAAIGLGVGVGPRPHRLVAGPERVDQRRRVVEVLEREQRDQRRPGSRSPRSGPGSRSASPRLACTITLPGWTSPWSRCGRCGGFRQSASSAPLRPIDRLGEHRPVGGRELVEPVSVPEVEDPVGRRARRPAGRDAYATAAVLVHDGGQRADPAHEMLSACTAREAAARATHSNSTHVRAPGTPGRATLARPPTPSLVADHRGHGQTRCRAGARRPTRPRAPRSRRRGYADSGSRASAYAVAVGRLDAEHRVERLRDERAHARTSRSYAASASRASARSRPSSAAAVRSSKARGPVTAGRNAASTCARPPRATSGRSAHIGFERLDLAPAPPRRRGARRAACRSPPTTSTPAPARPRRASSSPDAARRADERAHRVPQLVDALAEQRRARPHPVDGAVVVTRARGAARGRSRRRCAGRGRRASPSALLTTTRSASSTIPRFTPCSSSPAPGASSSTNRSTMPATATSDWPTPTVSTSTTSKPAASHTSSASRVRRATPPSVPPDGDGRMNASGPPRELLHPRLVAEDRAAAARARRVDREHRDSVPGVDEVQPERLDERRLPRARRAADPDTGRAAGRGQDRRRAARPHRRGDRPASTRRA